MVAFRRSSWNFALDRALEWCRKLNRPLLVFEPLRHGYTWASDRHHQFIIDGMKDNQQAFQEAGVAYLPFVETAERKGAGKLEGLAERACLVVSDDYPCFFLPRMHRAVAPRLGVRFELVDSNGLYPMRLAEKTYSRAVDFRRHLQKTLEPHFDAFPNPKPLHSLDLPRLEQLPFEATDLQALKLDELPIDHSVKPVGQGGSVTARQRLTVFLQDRLEGYDEDRNHPQRQGTSGLSPYLHYGHVSTHQIFSGLARDSQWNPSKLSLKTKGQREGWWGMKATTEAFLDQIVTWRELGFNTCARHDDYDRYESLPEWAQKTLGEHAEDTREWTYSLEQFEDASTHEPLWNAAQNQLKEEGTIHNYLRMLWGKKVLHWCESPQRALEIVLHLNNKYGLDGRDPNSYSGVFWVFGRYDRAWGPERPIFGKIRYMTCDSTRRKYKVDNYVSRWT